MAAQYLTRLMDHLEAARLVAFEDMQTFPAPYKWPPSRPRPTICGVSLIDDPGGLASRLAARLVVITRPLSRISPPVWSSIAARLVAFHPPNYLNVKCFLS
jgi:hypothetical protein